MQATKIVVNEEYAAHRNGNSKYTTPARVVVVESVKVGYVWQFRKQHPGVRVYADDRRDSQTLYRVKTVYGKLDYSHDPTEECWVGSRQIISTWTEYEQACDARVARERAAVAATEAIRVERDRKIGLVNKALGLDIALSSGYEVRRTHVEVCLDDLVAAAKRIGEL